MWSDETFFSKVICMLYIVAKVKKKNVWCLQSKQHCSFAGKVKVLTQKVRTLYNSAVEQILGVFQHFNYRSYKASTLSAAERQPGKSDPIENCILLLIHNTTVILLASFKIMN